MEFALVTAAVIVVAGALGVLADKLAGGVLFQHALASASHSVDLVAPGFLPDIFSY